MKSRFASVTLFPLWTYKSKLKLDLYQNKIMFFVGSVITKKEQPAKPYLKSIPKYL